MRAVEVGDIEEVARMWEFEKGCISIDEAHKAIDYMQDNHMKNKAGHIYHLCLGVFEKNQRKIIGWCGLDGKTDGKLYIFFLIDAYYRNKGYATQCAERLLAYAFNEVHVPFINGGCDKSNIASYKVMSKIGMTQNAFEENGDPIFIIDKDMYSRQNFNICKLNYSIKGIIEPVKIANLRKTVGWNGMENSYRKSLANSYFYICCYDKNCLVGFLDVISNGVTDAYIQDVVVSPVYQRKGIATEMMIMAINKLKQDGIYAISVLFDEQLQSFYEKFGFHIMMSGQMETRKED